MKIGGLWRWTLPGSSLDRSEYRIKSEDKRDVRELLEDLNTLFLLQFLILLSSNVCRI